MPTPLRRSGPRAAAGRVLGVAAGLLAAVASSAACSTGFEAETVQIYNASSGVDLRAGDIDVLGALIVTDGEGNGTLVAGLVPSLDTADALVQVDVTDADGNPFTTTIAGGSLEIPPDDLVQTAEDAAVTVRGDGLTPGRMIEAVFTFERSGPVSGQLPVVSHSGAYAEVPVAPPTTAPTTEPTEPTTEPTEPTTVSTEPTTEPTE